MTQNLLKTLYLGKELSEDELQDIPNYRAELHFHVMYKNAQFGAISGLLVFGPMLRLYLGPRTIISIAQSSLKASKIGMGILIPASPIMTEAAIRNSTEERIFDRSYRIRSNQGQMRTDRYATYGGVLGGAVTSLLGYKLVPGLISGLVAGTLTAGLIVNPKERNKK